MKIQKIFLLISLLIFGLQSVANAESKPGTLKDLGKLYVDIIATTRGYQILPVQRTKIAVDDTTLRAIYADLQRSGALLLMSQYAHWFTTGYYKVTALYKKGNTEHLTALHQYNPRIFANLDYVESVLARHLGQEAVTNFYGYKTTADSSVNWDRYAKLAEDATSLVSMYGVVMGSNQSL